MSNENAVKMIIQVSNERKYNSVNVRSEENEIIGTIKNGTKVDVFDFDSSNERNLVKGVQMGTRKKIIGNVLTRCLKSIE